MEPKNQQQQQMEDYLNRLNRLKTLYESNLITQQDFESRKSQIVDEITGTTNHSSYKRTNLSSSQLLSLTNEKKTSQLNNHLSDNHNVAHNEKKNTPRLPKIEVKHHPPPDWSKIRVEKAEKWTFDYTAEQWKKEICKVKIDEQPFEKGGLRYVFHLQDLSCPTEQWVAKMSQDIRDNTKRNIYFNDVRMQAIARYFCHCENGYNSYDPPKKVDFLEAFVLDLKQREGSPVCHVEKYIGGDYKKYNNNIGWVSEDERNTPQAFAHFTYEASKHRLLVCDIQGVNDIYTDPQVHTSQLQKEFGKGNLGQKGFENFLRTHRCNPICQYLKLPNINALPIEFAGTLPAQTYIPQGQIGTVVFEFPNQNDTLLNSN